MEKKMETARKIEKDKSVSWVGFCLRFEIPIRPQDRILSVNMMENDKPLNLQLPYVQTNPYVVYLKWWIPKSPWVSLLQWSNLG